MVDKYAELKKDFGREFETIESAYRELTRPAFAVWIRMMVIPERFFLKGRNKMAKKLGYSEPGADPVFRELSRKGYLKLESSGPFVPVKITLVKRLILKGDDHIVNMG